jgi:DNA-directed RNA polymerase subunit K/omega
MKFRSRSEIIDRIPNKFDAVIVFQASDAVEGKKRLTVHDERDKENCVKVAMEEIAKEMKWGPAGH